MGFSFYDEHKTAGTPTLTYVVWKTSHQAQNVADLFHRFTRPESVLWKAGCHLPGNKKKPSDGNQNAWSSKHLFTCVCVCVVFFIQSLELAKLYNQPVDDDIALHVTLHFHNGIEKFLRCHLIEYWALFLVHFVSFCVEKGGDFVTVHQRREQTRAQITEKIHETYHLLGRLPRYLCPRLKIVYLKKIRQSELGGKAGFSSHQIKPIPAILASKRTWLPITWPDPVHSQRELFTAAKRLRMRPMLYFRAGKPSDQTSESGWNRYERKHTRNQCLVVSASYFREIETSQSNKIPPTDPIRVP